MTISKITINDEGRVFSRLSRNLIGLGIALRPKEWIKNSLVFTSLIFSGLANDPQKIILSLLGFVLFSAASSGVYLVNDLCDLADDRLHPVKKQRPIPSGLLSPVVAGIVAALLLAASLLGSFFIHAGFAGMILLYEIIFIFYSLKLKTIVILDAILIASGFVIRAVSGAILIGVAASEWLVLCTSLVALFISFGKRRHEMGLLGESAAAHRSALAHYSIGFLDSVMNITSAAAIVTYLLYTTAESTVSRIGSRLLMLTIPFVIYGILRYIMLVQNCQKGGEPVRLLYEDFPSKLNLALWLGVSIIIIYKEQILNSLSQIML